MALMARLTPVDLSDSPEALLADALSVIFPDDATNQHGDVDEDLLYTSPHLRRPLLITLCDPHAEAERHLFSHFLWNSSLLLAEFVEGGTVGVGGGGEEERGKERGEAVALSAEAVPPDSSPSFPSPPPAPGSLVLAGTRFGRLADFDVTGLSTLELGAGTALPSMLAALYGAAAVTITDYPAPVVLENLRANVARNVEGQREEGATAAGVHTPNITVQGHEWGVFDTPLAQQGRHAYDRLFVCDCLWMPWQHANLRQSISWFLKEGGGDVADHHVGDGSAEEPSSSSSPSAPCCLVVGGFHTGRAKMAGFFDADALAAVDLEVESIWERDCDGVERPWVVDRGVEDASERKRWLAMAVLRRPQKKGQLKP